MKSRKLRASLTILSVVIGVTAIIALASLGEGFRFAVKTRMEQGFELDALTVIPGSLFAGLSHTRFTDAQIHNISQISNVKIATGVMQMGNATLYNGSIKTSAFVVTAVNFSVFDQVYPDRLGDYIEGGWPEHPNNNSIVLGYNINYGNGTQPFAHVGDNITIKVLWKYVGFTPVFKESNFTVAGILQQKGTPGLTNFDYWVFIPLETGKKIFEVQNPDYADLIFAKVTSSEVSEQVAKEIEALFPPFQISVLVPITFIRQVDSILNLIQLFLTSIAAISLLVAGIGIMNIMTVSVMERTREIGIMKAIGAKERTILAMVLSETILIGLTGGLIGVPAGYGFAQLLSIVLTRFMLNQQGGNTGFPSPQNQQQTTVNPVFSLEWTIIALVFAVLVCVIFGWYPARKAAKLDPVQALRYE
jgi:putative ABC transport system permease protein